MTALEPQSAAVVSVAAGEETQSAVAWPAVFAGAVAALALGLVLLTLGAGFGYALAWPWPSARPVATAFSAEAGAAMIAAQVLSCALGGYLAGRLRTKWLHVHTHEVFFRDTAHGLLAWAASVVMGATLAAITAVRPAEAVALAGTTTGDAAAAARLSFFLAIGLMLSAFTASVAAALGGMRRDDMHARHRAP